MTGRNNHFMWKETKRIPRYSLRKLNVGVASVLLGVTIFGFNVLIDQTKVSANTTAISAKDTSTASINLDDKQTLVNKTGVVPATNDDKQTLVNKTGVVPATNNSGSTSINSADTTASDNVDKEAISTNNEETVPSTNNTNVGSSNSMDKSAPINDDKAVQPANNAKDTTETTSVVTPTSTDPTTSNNEEASTSLPWYSFSLVTTSNNEEPSTSLPISNQDIKLDSQPMLTEIINKPTDNWVYKNLGWFRDTSTAKVKEILQNHTTDDESGRYYFGGVANYNEHYHVIYLLARSNNLNDNNLYVTILHTGKKIIQEAVVAPGESKPVEYSGTTYTPIFTNYDGTSVSIDLDGIEKGDDIYGMVVGFAYGQDTGISGDPASMGNGFMTTPMPTKTTTTIHYIDQATGDELAVPKSFEGVAYQKYTITGEAPTIDGYTLKKSPKTTGSISPYKVGESYDFRLDKHVVIKQTVINAQGLVRVTAYYDGEAIDNTTRYLGNMSNVNDHYSFGSHGKWYTYINQITSTNDGIVYYYAKDGSEDKSEVRVHYIDVTGNKSSLFVPGDGKEVATDKISGKLGENYNYKVNLPTDYNLATNQANTVNGTYTIDHHDEYVYVVKKTSAEKLDPTVPATTKVDNPKKLTDDEKKEVAGKVTEANKDKFPEKTEVTVADDGTVTINYPDGSQDTIPGDQVVEAKKDADKTNPTVPATTKVDNPKKLTDDEKKEVAG
uniref:YSIRK-type signal peptide-containing protein n=1 Tax=Ligilactobacillus saerimneri TaxID=228229 RepID=UPI0024B92C93